jgi:carboxypeptidase C (cathepsin A)
MDTFHPVQFRGSGSLILNGEAVSYETVSEDNVFYDETGKPVASIFSFSYFRTDVKDRTSRPVLFCFNGGPGASSMMVHAGCFGAKRVAYPDSTEAHPSLPPYKVIDNPNCLLDVADVVMVDPVGTGFGLLLDDNADKDFLGIDEDAEALVVFIQHWLSKYGRWNSPKYLVGESYGCTRAATAAAIACSSGKNHSYHITFNGIIFIGNTVATAKYFNKGAPVEPAVEALPTMAAINWYHKLHGSIPLKDFVNDATEFATGEYLVALYKGESLAPEERKNIKEKIMYYTGVSDEYLEAHDLKVERFSFCRELLKDEGKVVSILDGRFTRPVFEPTSIEGTKGFATDAASERYGALFEAGLCGEIFDSLGIKDFDRVYVTSCSYGTELVPGSRWNFETASMNSAERLSFAMHSTPGMRLLFVNGYFDLCTQTGIIRHTISHSHLDPERVFLREYPSGHMAYIGEENVKNISNDIRAFITEKSQE